MEFSGRATLGETWSIFGNLGGIDARATVQRVKFLVGEVRGILEAEAAGRLVDRRITLARTAGGTVVVDGNKRAAAIYELAGADVALPAFLIESAPGYPPLPTP